MANQYFLARITGYDPDLRAADADREQTAERLRNAHTEGRLDLTEFQERLDSAYDAKTFGELAELVRDLPRQQERDDRQSAKWLSPGRLRLALLAAVVLAVIASSAVTGHGHEHNFAWVWIPLAFLFWRLSWGRRRGRLGGAGWRM